MLELSFSKIEREKMKELLTKYQTTMTTPLYQNREMDFDGPDPEFSGWGFEGTTLHFKIRDGGANLTLKWDGREFSGRDPRGGYSSLTIDSTKLEKFRESIRANGKVQYKKEQSIEKNSDIAIISEYEQEFGDTYHAVSNQKQFVSELFSAGYEEVYVLDFVPPKAYFQSASRTINLLNCHFLNAEGHQQSKSTIEIHRTETLNNYVIPKSTWLRIKGKVMKNNKNFTTSCQQAAKELDLKIYAFSKSRMKNKIPNESTLKNFKLVNEKEIKSQTTSQEKTS